MKLWIRISLALSLVLVFLSPAVYAAQAQVTQALPTETVSVAGQVVTRYPPRHCTPRWHGYRRQSRNVRVPSRYIVNAMHLRTAVYYHVFRNSNCNWFFEVIGARDCWNVEYGLDPHVPGNLGTFRRSRHNTYMRDSNEVYNPNPKYVYRNYSLSIQRVNCDLHDYEDEMMMLAQKARWKVNLKAEIISYPDWDTWTRWKRFRVRAKKTTNRNLINFLED